MELVVDANVLLASFLKDALTRELLLDSRLTLYAPEHLISETSRHFTKSAEIRKRIRLTHRALQQLFGILTLPIRTVSQQQSYAHLLDKALGLAPHPEDAPYLAVAALRNIPIWSNDRGLKKQTVVRIFTTGELLSALDNNR